MNSIARKGMSLALCVLLVVSALAGALPARQEDAYAAEKDAEYDDKLSNAKLYEKWTDQDQPDDFYSIIEDPTAEDPYGYGVDVPFYMNKQSELVVYGTNNMYHDKTTKRQIKSYNLTSPLSTGDLLAGQTINRKYDIPQGSDGTQTKPLSYVKMTAFDPEGTGRKDHLAVLGVYNETEGSDDGNKTLYLLVYNKEGTLTSEYTALGNVSWMGDRHDDDDNCWYFNSGNFLDITAGDYDGNKKDTLVIWGCFDGTGYTLKEVKTEDQKENISVSVLKSSSELLHDKYTASGSSLATGGGDASKEWVDNKLCCAVDTGDLNGDRVDDLVVLSFVDRLTDSFSGKRQHLEMYRPYLTARYGQKSKDPLVAKTILGEADAAAEVMDPQGNNEYLTCVAAGLSTGDINGDGVDEAVIAGMKNVITGTPNTAVSKDSQCYSLDDNKAVIAAYDLRDKTAVKKKIFEEQDANDWTVDSIYLHDDDVWPQYGVQCAAINGKGNPELIFVNGDLYSGDGKLANLTMEKYDDRYFDQSDDTMYGNTDLANTFIASVDAGNFDGNSCGREQVIFTIGLKTKDHERYFMATGMIGGNFVNEPSDGIAKDYSFTSDNAYESSNYKSIYFPGTSNGKEIYAFLSDNNALNYCVCAMDNDDDGLLVRYHSKGYVYTDPEILGVLQAAPRYDELGKYAEDRATTYSFTHTVSYEDTKSDSVAFGAGVTHGLEGTLGGYDLRAGYAMEWSQEFTSGFEETEEYSFTAYDEDAVVMYRTPVTVYGYQIKLKDGTWENAKKDNIISLSFPGTPAYSIITVDRYNEFADYYNKTNREKMKKLGKDPEDAPELALLNDTDTQKLYLDTGGDPAKYIQKRDLPSGVNMLQKKANAFEVSTGATGFSYENAHSESRTDSMSHGFTYELTIEFGLGIECFVSSSVGAYVSLEYMSGHSHSTATADGKGVSCEIDNANETEMMNDGFSEAACNSYGYNYQVATWDSPITKSVPTTDPLTQKVTYKEEKVPVFGYVLSDVKKPSYALIKAPDDLVLYTGYGLSTSGSFRVFGDPIPTVTKVSGNGKITYNAITRKLEVAPGLKVGTYPVKLKAVNGVPGKEYTATFKVVVKEPDYSENGVIANVKNLIAGLPKPEELLLSDEVFVQQARNAYDALTDAQKNKITAALKTKLENAEAQIKGFRDAATGAQELIASKWASLEPYVKSLNDLFDKNKVPTDKQILDMESSLAEMTEAYGSLTNEQKALVSDETVKDLNKAISQAGAVLDRYDEKIFESSIAQGYAQDNEKKAKEVRDLIDEIGDMSAIDPASADEGQFEALYQAAFQKIQAARKAYDLLTIQQKNYVTNFSTLAAAEKTIGSLHTLRCNEIFSQQEEKAYQDAVSKLGKVPGTVKLKLDGAVYAARYAYDKLSPEKKKTIAAGLVSKLTAAEKKIASFRKAISKNGTSIKKVKGAKKALNVSWKKQTKKVSGTAITGYEIQAGLNKKFTKGSKAVKVKGLKKVKATVKKLKAKKNYFVRVRCYTKTGAATYYSKWSKVKKAKTK